MISQELKPTGVLRGSDPISGVRVVELIDSAMKGEVRIGGLQGQVCIASRGKVKKLCTEVKAGASADVSIRALRGSGGLESP